jgi:uncharacterized protein YraI
VRLRVVRILAREHVRIPILWLQASIAFLGPDNLRIASVAIPTPDVGPLAVCTAVVLCRAREEERPAVPTAPSQRGRRRALKLCLAAALIISGLAEFAVAPARAKAASIATTTARLNLRTGPSLEHGIITTMPNGAEVSITGDPSGGFYPVVYDGMEGWAYGDYLNMGGGGGGASGSAVVTSALNLRAGPSTSDAILAVMPTGASVTLTGDSANGFVSLSFNGLNGWGYSAYVGNGGGTSNQEAAPLVATGASVTGTATTTSDLNLRSGPSTSHQVLNVIPSGAQVDILGDPQSGFYPVSYGSQSGWSYGDYLRIGGGGNEEAASGNGGSSNSIVDIIYAAADRYGQNRAAMLQVAQCESLLDPGAVNRTSGASGLFQFLPGTFASTPYANYDIFDAWANANAAAWMWSVGRRGEWVC